MPGWEARTEMERFAAKLRDMEAQLRTLRTGLRIPFVDTDPDANSGNIWAFPDGRIRVRLPSGTIMQITMAADAGSTSTVAMPTPETQEATYQATWDADWSRSYQQTGVARSDTQLFWGKADAVNGVQTALIGLPYATIATALSGATINKVEVLLHVSHTGWEAGGTVQLHGHSNATAPATLGGVSSTSLASMAVVGSDVGGVQGWRTVSRALGQELAEGTIKGFSLSAVATSLQHYGEAYGVGSGVVTPAVRITYVL